MSSEGCLIVEDLADSRGWLVGRVQAAFPGIAVAEAASLREARAWLEGYDSRPPFRLRLALVDIGLPDGCGVELVRELARRRPATPAVVVTVYGDDSHLMEALTAGAAGYILKQEEPEAISERLRRIDAGEPPLSPSIAARILAHFRDRPPPTPDGAGLTPREVEVLTLLAQGLTVAEAAGVLSLKPQTVASYVKTIYHKLNVSNRAEAALAAAQRGLV